MARAGLQGGEGLAKALWSADGCHGGDNIEAAADDFNAAITLKR